MISPFSSLNELQSALRSKQISSVELTRMYLDRLKTLGREHNAVAELTEDLGMNQARAADRTSPKSPLHGIPYGAKDLLATRGIPTRWGSPGHSDQVFDYDATVITKLREAGAVLVAKLEMIELAGGGNYDQANASRMVRVSTLGTSGCGRAEAAVAAERQPPWVALVLRLAPKQAAVSRVQARLMA